MKNTRFLFSVFILVLWMPLIGFSQANDQKQLEERKQEIQEEIQQTNRLLANNKKQTRSVLEQLEAIDLKVKAQQKLIAVINEQARLLNRNIRDNKKQISKLESDLKILKDDYAQMVVKTYKSKSKQSRLMFLLSSDNFLQAYKRVQYLNQYNNYRKQQGEELIEKKEEIRLRTDTLNLQLATQQKLLKENQAEEEKLKAQQKVQQLLVNDLRKKERTYARQIRDKQKEIDRIDKQIQTLIDAAISRANKSAGSSAVSKFALTPEAKLLADNFLSNKGQLPWPVEKGLVVMRFGKQPHPFVKNVFINSNGVRIATEEGAKARAVFEGEVLEVQIIKGANKTVFLQHGNYISVYNNLDEVYVKKGEKVKIYQEIGKVHTDASSGETLLKFSIFRDSEVQNPAQWIYRM